MVYVVIINTLGCLCETMVVGLNVIMNSQVGIMYVSLNEMKTGYMEGNAHLYT